MRDRLIVLFAALALLCGAGGALAQEQEQEQLTLGVFAYRPKAALAERLQPLVRHLEQSLDNTRVDLQVLDLDEMERALARNQLDLVLTNPSHYMILRSMNTLSGVLATLVSIDSGEPAEALGGVILTRSTRPDIDTLADLERRRVAVPGRRFLGGYQTQAYELVQAGVALDRVHWIETGSHDAALQAVLVGSADAAFVRTGIVEEWAAAGRHEVSDLRVVNQQAFSGFPYAVSTRLYPEWPFVALPRVRPEQVRRLTGALLALGPDHPVSQASGIGGFTTAADYRAVEELARALRAPPFDAPPGFTLRDLWDRHWKWIVSILALQLVVGLLVLRLASLARQLGAQRQRMSEVLWGSDVGTWEWEIATGRIVFNERWATMLGYTPAELAPLSFDRWKDMLNPEDVPLMIAQVQRHLSGQDDRYTCSFRMRRKDGQWLWVRARGRVVARDRRGHPLRFSGIHSDISAQKAAEQRLTIAASVFEHLREGIIITGPDARIIEVNAAFSEITGYPRAEVIGQNPRLLQSGQHDAAFFAAMWNDLSSQGFWRGEIWNRNKSGETYPEILSISAVTDARGATTNYVAVFSDITPIKQMERQLEHMAYHDALTGLPNRMLFADRLGNAIAQHARRGQQLAVLYIDLDGFKPVNDNHGHAAGDTVLKVLSRRMRESLRESDTLARLGGDEFAALLTELASAEQAIVAVERLMTAVRAPVQLGADGVAAKLSSSVGIAFFPADGETADALLHRADKAMYAAKESGKGVWRTSGDVVLIGKDSDP